jgi:AraC-like DNA-binding protein
VSITAQHADKAWKAYAFHKTFETPFDTGWRQFDQHYLLYASSGNFNLEIGDRTWLLPPQRAAMIAAHTDVRIWTSTSATSSSVLFSDAAMPIAPQSCRVFACSPLVIEMIRYAMRWDEKQARSNNEADTFFAALAQVCGELAETPAQTWLPRAKSKELTRALDYALKNLHEELSVDDLAEVAFLSRRTLARRFVDEIGFTWPQFLRRARMIRAAELLATPRANTTLVAHAVGYASISAFINGYKAFFGETPMQYCKRLRGDSGQHKAS